MLEMDREMKVFLGQQHLEQTKQNYVNYYRNCFVGTLVIRNCYFVHNRWIHSYSTSCCDSNGSGEIDSWTTNRLGLETKNGFGRFFVMQNPPVTRVVRRAGEVGLQKPN